MKKYFSIVFCFLVSACANSQRTNKTMPHYDLSKPEVFAMPHALREISGIAVHPVRNDMMLAIQDEEGKLFYFSLGERKPLFTKFGPGGDYEDITVYGNTVFVLRSDGQLFSFPLAQALAGTSIDARSLTGLLPRGEYEGLFADRQTDKLYVLCKQCSGKKKSGTAGGSVFSILKDGSLTPAGAFQLDVGAMEMKGLSKKAAFRPSALARNYRNGDWFVLSSVNSVLVVADSNWKIKEVYPLNKALFNQPEGIAFDSLNNLYISNEAGSGPGNILKFGYRNQ